MIRYHLISEEETYGARLNTCLANCRSAMLATAFLTKGGLDAINESLQVALDNGAQVTFLIGRLDYVTEPIAIKRLLKTSERCKGKKGRLRVFFDADYGFHFKVALFQEPSNCTVLIGSSNLTPKGLASKGEHNLEITEHWGLYRQHRKLLEARLDPNQEGNKQIEEYAKAYKRARRFRATRTRLFRGSSARWGGSRPVKPPKIDNNSFLFFVVEDRETDKVFIGNIEKEKKQIRRTTLQQLPGQWLSSWSKKSVAEYNEEVVFVLCDTLGKSIGLAVCRKKIYAKDENGRERPVIFYRFIRNWKIQCHSNEFDQTLQFLGVSPKRKRRVGVKFKEKLETLIRKRYSERFAS